MGTRCKNCGKLRKTHYDKSDHKRDGDWCYSVKKFPPRDERYFMRFELKDEVRDLNENG